MNIHPNQNHRSIISELAKLQEVRCTDITIYKGLRDLDIQIAIYTRFITCLIYPLVISNIVMYVKTFFL